MLCKKTVLCKKSKKACCFKEFYNFAKKKMIIRSLRVIVILLSFFMFFSCKSGVKNQPIDSLQTRKVVDTSVVLQESKDTTTEDSTDTGLGKEYTSKYICPMHCKGSGSDKPGYCPVCGMQYIENPDYHKKK